MVARAGMKAAETPAAGTAAMWVAETLAGAVSAGALRAAARAVGAEGARRRQRSSEPHLPPTLRSHRGEPIATWSNCSAAVERRCLRRPASA